jgi:hypothetical protein
MAFPYVAISEDETLENSLLSGFSENCEGGSPGNHITYTDTCATSSESMKKHSSMDSIQVSFLLLLFILPVYYSLCIDTIYILGLGEVTHGKQPNWTD